MTEVETLAALLDGIVLDGRSVVQQLYELGRIDPDACAYEVIGVGVVVDLGEVVFMIGCSSPSLP
jgi:hypothetical protein